MPILKQSKSSNFLQKNILFFNLHILNSINDLNQFLRSFEDINFVPTMGNLHAGHLKLVSEANKFNGATLTSIYVNPLQFAPNEDLDIYPRTLDQDFIKLEKISCDALFCPEPDFASNAIRLSANPMLSNKLCGISRPHFFDGVITILNHFFQLIRPNNVFFGLKDYQQYLVVKDFLSNSNLNIDIHGVPTQREIDGLAMSSRNNLMSAEQRLNAKHLSIILKEIAQRAHHECLKDLKTEAIKRLEELNFDVDYLLFCNSTTLEELTEFESNSIVAIAAKHGDVRLIDNFIVN